MAEFAKELEAAMRAADAARPVLLSYFGNLSQVSEKDQAGLVTEADRASEEKILEILKSEFPEHVFLGEESGLSTGKQLHDDPAFTDGCVWMIDPLDGTTNYVHQFPIFCISIGLQVRGELAVAVIDVPILKQRFHAVRGGGAYVNGQKIYVAKRQSWHEVLLATGFSVSGEKEIHQQVEMMKKFLVKTRGIRRAGAAAYDLCLVAQGVMDAFWEASLSPWDTAAGTLLVREAGGVVTNYQGEKYQPRMRDIVAGSSAIHAKLLADIKSCS